MAVDNSSVMGQIIKVGTYFMSPGIERLRRALWTIVFQSFDCQMRFGYKAKVRLVSMSDNCFTYHYLHLSPIRPYKSSLSTKIHSKLPSLAISSQNNAPRPRKWQQRAHPLG